jgi:transcriptional regulator of arginine metabolism
MQKTKRLMAIEKILAAEVISSHEMLLRRLRSKGFTCTQATLSRDLRQLGAGRVSGQSGSYRYLLPDVYPGAQAENTRVQVLPAITGIVDAKGLVVIRTLPGNANNTAIFIDNASRYEIAGTIAGDDTILVIPREGITNKQVHTCLEIIIPGLQEHLRNK